MQKIYVSSKMLCLRFIKGLSIFLFSISISTFGLCQATNPVPYDLSLGSLIRTGLNPAVSDYPQNIQGWSSGTNNLVVPPASNTTSPLADEPLIINGTSSTFGLSNLGLNGYNFLATSSSPYQQVGAIALSLNTSNRSFLQVTWTAEDQTAGNTREMNLTLQYRIGTTGNFIAISGSTYTSNNFNKKAPTTFSNVLLPNVCNNKPVVQLRWIYFESAGQTGVGVDAIRLDDIYVFSSASLACTPPTIQSLIPNFSVPVLAAATNTITPVITTGDGIGHIIVVKQGSAVTGVPVDGVDYLTGLNTNFSLSTSTIAPGEKVVYSGTGSTTVTGLTPNVIYHFAVFEYSANSCYLTPAGVGNINTLACTTPTAASAAVVSNVTNNAATLSWTNGSSTNRLVVLNAASNVTGVPVDGAAYTANADYSVAPAFTPGTGKIVYNGTGNTVNITGLTNNITYYAQIFEYRAISNCYGIATSTNFSTGIASFVAFDNFDRANNNNVGIPSSMGLTPPAWTEFENAATNATIVSNALQLTSCLAGTCITGKEAISYDMAAQYATTFAFANANLQWHFNMKQSRSTGDLSGFGNSDYGMAFI